MGKVVINNLDIILLIQSCSGDDGGSASAASAEIDPWDLLDAVDLTRKLANNFDELVISFKSSLC